VVLVAGVALPTGNRRTSKGTPLLRSNSISSRARRSASRNLRRGDRACLILRRVQESRFPLDPSSARRAAAVAEAAATGHRRRPPLGRSTCSTRC